MSKYDELESVIKSCKLGGSWPKVWERNEVIEMLIEDVRLLAAALEKYENPDNWANDKNGWGRIWLEPDTEYPRSYDGHERAHLTLRKFRGEI